MTLSHIQTLHHLEIVHSNWKELRGFILDVQSMLFKQFQANWMIVELKGSSVKERHWKQLMKQLRVIWTLSDLTLGQVT